MLSLLVNKIVIIPIIYYTALAAGASLDENSTSITIPLNKTYTYENREIYGKFIYLNSSTTIKVDFTNIDSNLTFILFQVHSHYHNITLYQNEKTYSTQVSGTNIGMVSVIKPYPDDIPKIDVFYIENMDKSLGVRIYISVHAYGMLDPYPGGCNIEFQVNIAPYLVVKTDDSVITVDGAIASLDSNCGITLSNLSKFYMMYLPEMSFNEEEYFIGIRRMMTLESIERYGSNLPQTSIYDMRRTLSSYPGTGVVVVAVAYNVTGNKGYSVYVPNHSYGCPNMDEDGCIFVHDIFSQMLCVILLAIGLFVTFFGHRFFKTEMFIAGFFSGFIITYILITLFSTGIDISDLLAASALSGVFFGAIWLLFWWLYGIPIVAVLLPSLNLGYLIAGIFYYRLSVYVPYLRSDLNFWSLFIILTMVTALALTLFTYAANIMCCAILGAYAFVYAVDYYVGSTFKYIFINIIRRAVVPSFKYAIVAPPFQWREIMMTVMWVSLACLGWTFQHLNNYRRAPFPPIPRSIRQAAREQTNYGAVNNTTIGQERPSIMDRLSRSSAAFRNYWFGRNNEQSSLLA